MMVIEPVTLGDVACTRASTGTYFDRSGVMQTAVANALRVTYDPADLTKAPYALVEPAATQLFAYTDIEATATGSPPLGLSGSAWSSVTVSTDIAPLYGTKSVKHSYTGDGSQDTNLGVKAYTAPDNSYFAAGCYVFIPRAYTGSLVSFSAEHPYLVESTTISGLDITKRDVWQRVEVRGRVTIVGSGVPLVIRSNSASPIYSCCWQAVAGSSPVTLGSFIPNTTAGFVSRAADVIATNAGLAYTNIPIAETAYSAATTYAKDVKVYDPVTYAMYVSLIASNLNKALSDTTAWAPLNTSINRWMMFDQYNNTQTTNAEEILIVLSPRAIAQGLYLGNVDGAEVRISAVDANDGLVYQEVQSLITPNSGSSFFNWAFKRIKRRSYVVTVQLLPYSAALVTICIRKPGGIAKCGMCVIGPVIDVGLSQYGLSREIKDYSTVDFKFDGTSNFVVRNFAKLMSVDVTIENDNIDTVIETLENYRQKPLAWIGTVSYGSACLFGTYTSFKNVIPYPTQSVMSLQLQGTV